MRRKLLILLFALAALPACGSPIVTPAARKARLDAAFDELLGLMRARLAVMHDVARWKWSARSPIEDPDREAILLREVADRGASLGLDPATTRAFFAAQIEAAKLVQQADFRRWAADPPPADTPSPDLATVLMPRIDALNRDLLAALSRAVPSLHSDAGAGARILIRADALLSGDGIDAPVRAAAIRPLILAAAE